MRLSQSIFLLVLCTSTSIAQNRPSIVRFEIIAPVGSKLVIKERSTLAPYRTIDSVTVGPKQPLIFTYKVERPVAYIINDNNGILAEGGEIFRLKVNEQINGLPNSQIALNSLASMKSQIEDLEEKYSNVKESPEKTFLKSQIDSLKNIYKPQALSFLDTYGKSWVGIYGFHAAVSTDIKLGLFVDQTLFERYIIPLYTYNSNLKFEDTKTVIGFVKNSIDTRLKRLNWYIIVENLNPYKQIMPPPVKYILQEDLNRSFSLSDLAGKTVIVIHECGQGKYNLRDIEYRWKQLAPLINRKDVIIISVNVWNQKEVEKINLNNTSQATPEMLAYQVINTFSTVGQQFPNLCDQLYVFDKQGKWLYGGVGFKRGRDFKKVLEIIESEK